MKTNNKTFFSFPFGKVAYFVTTNIHKFYEAQEVLSQYEIGTAKLKVEAIEIQDDRLEEIARFSALDAIKNCGLPIFVEDAGFFVEALGGFPGPYSAYIYRTIGPNGVLKLMENVKNRNAHFQSVIAFCSPQEKPVYFKGEVEGKVSSEMKGNSGFGYDPIFIPNEVDGRTFAEMKTDEKNACSHRAQALRQFAEWYVAASKRRS